MPARKLTPTEREAHLATVASLLLQRRSYSDIGARLGVSKAQVCYDKKRLLERWQASAQQDLSVWVAEELASIEEQERQAWDAWQGSREEQTKTTQALRDGQGGQQHREQRIETTSSSGDPRFLQVLIALRRQRMELLGLTNAEVQVNIQNNINTPPPATTYDEWVRQNREMEEATGLGLHSAPPAAISE